MGRVGQVDYISERQLGSEWNKGVLNQSQVAGDNQIGEIDRDQFEGQGFMYSYKGQIEGGNSSEEKRQGERDEDIDTDGWL